MHAVWNNNVTIARTLLGANARVNATDGCQQTPLAMAVERNNVPMAALLIENGANTHVTGRTPKSFSAACTSPQCDYTVDGTVPVLDLAIAHNSHALMALLLQDGARMCSKDNNTSALVTAVHTGCVTTLRLLWKHGMPEVDFFAPMMLAVKHRNAKVVVALLESGATVNVCRNGDAPLFAALRMWDMEMVSLLLQHGAQTSILDTNGQSPLELLFLSEHTGLPPTWQLLVDQVFEHTRRRVAQNLTAMSDGEKNTALVQATLVGATTEVCALLAHDADCTHAAANGHVEIVQMLLTQEDPGDGPPPAPKCSKCGELPLASSPVVVGTQACHVNAVECMCMTALSLAVKHNHLPVVVVLLEHGADVQAGTPETTVRAAVAPHTSFPCTCVSMRVCVYSCIYVCQYVCVSVCLCVHVPACIPVSMSVEIHVCQYACVPVSVRFYVPGNVDVPVCPCVSACRCVHVHVCFHVSTSVKIHVCQCA